METCIVNCVCFVVVIFIYHFIGNTSLIVMALISLLLALLISASFGELIEFISFE